MSSSSPLRGNNKQYRAATPLPSSKTDAQWGNQNARIAIVGAGPAGIHMAAALKRRYGYQNITIYEAGDQIGGQCFSRVDDDGIPYEAGFWGNIVGSEDMPSPLQQLVRDYGLGDEEVVVGDQCKSESQSASSPCRAPVKLNRYATTSMTDGESVIITPQDQEEGFPCGDTSNHSTMDAPALKDDAFVRTMSDLSSHMKATATSDLTPLKRLLTRTFSDIKDQVNHFFGTEPLVQATRRYVRLHKVIFSNSSSGSEYSHGMPPQPKPEQLVRIDMSFTEFLKAHNLLELIPVFVLCPIVFSYHFLVEIPAFYGLWWFNPVRMSALIDLKTGTLRVPRYTVLKCGWQALWNKIAEEEQLQVQCGKTVKYIRRFAHDRLAGGELVVRLSQKGGERGEEQESVKEETHPFDLLILACNLKTILPVIADATEEERLLAGRLAEFTLCTTLVEAAVIPEERPVELFPFPKRNNAFGQVFAQVNPRLAVTAASISSSSSSCSGVIRKEEESDASTSALTSAGPMKDTRIVYQFLARSPRHVEDMAMVQRRLKMYLHDQNIQSPKVIKRFPFKFFPHFKNEDIVSGGWPWRLRAMQGQLGTLYLGGGAGIDCLEEVLLHNEAVLEQLFPSSRR